MLHNSLVTHHFQMRIEGNLQPYKFMLIIQLSNWLQYGQNFLDTIYSIFLFRVILGGDVEYEENLDSMA